MRRHAIKAALLAQTFVMVPGLAFGQTVSVPDDGLADIIVTANRVESSAQKTAVAINVYSGADLVAKGVTNVTALAAVDPSITITTNQLASYIAIRGVASTDTTATGDPSVPFSRDGFYTNREFALRASMYDVARVEVLKGPQGTLNGRNSTGGLVSVLTNRPSFENSGYVNVEGGNYGTFNTEGAVNLALSDRVAVRASGMFRRNDGYRFITGVNTRADDEHVWSGRFQIAARPTENLTLRLVYQHDDIDQVGTTAWKFFPIGTRPDSFGSARSFPGDFTPTTRLIDNRVQWEAKLDDIFGNLKVIYAGGRDEIKFNHVIDGTTPIYPAIRTFADVESPVTWNHEVRIANDPSDRLFVQAGYFHFLENNSLTNGFLNVSMTGPFAPGGPLAALSTAGRYGVFFQYKLKAESDAVFAQAAYAVTDKVKLTGGVRFTWDRKTRSGFSITDIQAVSSPFAPPIVLVSDGAGSYPEAPVAKAQPTFHLGIDYTPHSDALFYAKYDRGYKAGGLNNSDSGKIVPNYAPEKVDSFEIGAKTRWMGNRIQFNADAFYFNYANYQGNQLVSTGSGAAGTFNVGSAKVYGAEAQLTALFGQGGRIDLATTLLRTRMGNNIIINTGSNPPTPVDVSGNRLPSAPGMTLAGGIEYAFPALGGTLTPRADFKHSSKFYYSVFNNEDESSQPYTLLNANLTYQPDSRNWSVSAFVRNILDSVVLATAERNYLAGINAYTFQAPRTWGLRAGIQF